MAQGNCNRSKKNKQSALSKYKSWLSKKKFLVWLYFRSHLTQGREGFKCEGVAPGGKAQYQVALFAVKSHYTQKTLRNVFKTTRHIAIELRRESEEIEKPPLPEVHPDYASDEEEAENKEEEEERSDEEDDFVPNQQLENNSSGVTFTIIESLSPSPNKRKVSTRAPTTPQKQRNSTQQSPVPRTPTPRKATHTPNKNMSSGKERTRGLEVQSSMTMDDLSNLFNGASLEGYPKVHPAGVGVPILVGFWTKETENDDFMMTKESFILLPALTAG